ncbi:MAG: O-antigen ligase family protein [Gammaproteobacteria bacterium]|nr:O-antigen ligase family protein [Gammaproteobacteria bacterium]
MSRVVNALFWLLLVAFVLEFSLNVKISNIPGISLKNIAIYSLVMALLIVNPAQNQPLIAKNKVNVPIFLFIAYCLISLLATAMFKVVPNYSMFGQLILFKSYMDPYVLFILTYSLLHDEKSIHRLLTALVVLLVVFLAITVLSSFNIVSVERASVDDRWGRTRGAFAEANQFAAYLACFIPLLAAFFITAKSKVIKFVIAGIVFLALYVLLLTGSRGGLVALAVAIAVYYILASKQDIGKTLLNLIGIYLLIIFMVVLVFFTLPETTANGLLLKITGKFVEESSTDYSSGRFGMWTMALGYFISSPVFGTGWATFIPLFGGNSHNDYILFLVTLGVIGLYLFVRIFITLFKSAMYWRKQDQKYAQFYNAYIGGLSAFMVAMIFVNIYNPSYFVMMYSALILKLGSIASKSSPDIKSDESVDLDNTKPKRILSYKK